MGKVFIALIEQAEMTRNIVTFALIMARVMAIALLVPFLGGKSAPPQVKMGIGMTLTMILWPTVTLGMTGSVPLNPLGFVAMMVKEVFVGMSIGLVCAELFYAVSMSGQLIDMLRGASQIQVSVPELKEKSSAFGNLNYQLLLLLFLSLDLHAVFIESLFESFLLIPVNTWPGFHAGYWTFVDAMARVGGDLFFVAVKLSLPVAVVCLIIEVSFGLMNRVAPQINAYFMAMPAKVMAGCIMFLVSTKMIIDGMLHHTFNFLERIDYIIKLMS